MPLQCLSWLVVCGVKKYIVNKKLFYMADDPRKKKQDAKRVSQQPWEQAYQNSKKKNDTSNSTGRQDKPRGKEKSR